MESRIIPRFGLLVAGLCLAGNIFAVTLAPLFRNGAVLQRDKPLPIWGRAEAGEKIRVEFHGQVEETTASAAGTWRVTLAPIGADAQPSELLVTGTTTLRIHDVLVGDVWVCSGQSNMSFPLGRADNAKEAIATAKFPLIRQFRVPNLAADAPASDCPGSWVACSPATVGEFTAVGFFFARDLHQKLGVPLGIINTSWGGTAIESWMSAAALKSDPAYGVVFERWKQHLADYPAKLAAHPQAVVRWKTERDEAKAAGRPFNHPVPKPPLGLGSKAAPASLYNAMVVPLLPAAIRGIIWYQGEANAGRVDEYRSLFPRMIRQWRTDFGQGDLPFYFVQLANFDRDGSKTADQWAWQREAQAQALMLPATAMAVTIDIGNPDDIHPTNKQDVGARLARHARAQLFGEKIETDGPVYLRVRREGGVMRVSFTHAAGLRLVSAIDDGRVAFEVAGEDRRFVRAEAYIDDVNVLVYSRDVKAPVAVRYAWRNSPNVRLFNGAGLPAAPFRTDDWR